MENEILKNNVWRGRIENLKALGATEEDLAPLKNNLLYGPLENLDRFQDAGIIQAVEVRRLEGESE